jgi:small subunit ribosomal protein S16
MATLARRRQDPGVIRRPGRVAGTPGRSRPANPALTQMQQAVRFPGFRFARIFMSVTIRLTRAGAKKGPFYRLVAADSRSPRDGRFIEQLGVYDPLREPPEVRIDQARLQHWLSVGALPSQTVRELIRGLRRAAPPSAGQPQPPPK